MSAATYDVFDEDRYFEPASVPTVIEHAGQRIGVTICEDIWTHPMISTRQLYTASIPCGSSPRNAAI